MSCLKSVVVISTNGSWRGRKTEGTNYRLNTRPLSSRKDQLVCLLNDLCKVNYFPNVDNASMILPRFRIPFFRLVLRSLSVYGVDDVCLTSRHDQIRQHVLTFDSVIWFLSFIIQSFVTLGSLIQIKWKLTKQKIKTNRLNETPFPIFFPIVRD